MNSGLIKASYALSEELLAEDLPRRWAHSLGVARRARELRPILRGDTDLLESAAILHDIGYAPSVVDTGFHPLDGARFLRNRQAADERVIRLVAHHSCALLEAEERGLRDALANEFEVESPNLVDALIYCDMTTSPDGLPVSVSRRLDEIVCRYGPGDTVTRFIMRASPVIRSAVERVVNRLAMTNGDYPI